MPLKSNAAPDEKNSPFFRANKELCESWEALIKSKGGNINGVYNAWSLDVKAKVKTSKTWLISVKKATYSSGFLLFSSKRQNLQEILKFQSNFKETNCPDFRISNSRWSSKQIKHPFYELVKRLLENDIHGRDTMSAELKNGLLTLTFHHRNNDFELVDRVINLQF
ncbi:MAG: hypothetical protein Crog4KO_17560 [Crocinitomicaceae bacterium]